MVSRVTSTVRRLERLYIESIGWPEYVSFSALPKRSKELKRIKFGDDLAAGVTEILSVLTERPSDRHSGLYFWI